MPEYWLNAYQRMLPRLQAERTRSMINALLFASGHAMGDTDRRLFDRQLTDDGDGEMVRRRAPKVTPGFLQRLNVAARGRAKKGGE